MEYKIEVLLSAQIEIEKVLDYYEKISIQLSVRFEEEVASTYAKLSVNPFFRKRHEDFRAIPMLKFPFLLFYTIEENKKVVKIISCFHTSQNPKKYPESY